MSTQLTSTGITFPDSSTQGSAVVPGASGAIWENTTTIGANYTLTSNKNGLSVGPVTISSGAAVTVSSGARWVIL